MKHSGCARYADRGPWSFSANASSPGFSDAALTAFRRDHVGFVFQFYNLVPSLTARENVALVTENR